MAQQTNNMQELIEFADWLNLNFVGWGEEEGQLLYLDLNEPDNLLTSEQVVLRFYSH